MIDTSEIPSVAFGGLCIASALPFIGVPFPSRSAATYYAGKNQWMSQVTGGRLSPRGAGISGAFLRIAIGGCCIHKPTRVSALLVNGAVVSYGTIVALRDGRPMIPQFGMLSAIGVCLAIEYLS
ncbi:hypothetical protein GGR57DRAFT_487197 [Xylariaceae sp. FL1272]|nr:hypothetical protein GGR57DRAFT_487197 [Xylariaceae sp. FL1272]